MLLYPIQFININYPKSLTFNPLGTNVSKLYAQNASLLKMPPKMPQNKYE